LRVPHPVCPIWIGYFLCPFRFAEPRGQIDSSKFQADLMAMEAGHTVAACPETPGSHASLLMKDEK
jgi:hypothetical protein